MGWRRGRRRMLLVHQPITKLIRIKKTRSRFVILRVSGAATGGLEWVAIYILGVMHSRAWRLRLRVSAVRVSVPGPVEKTVYEDSVVRKKKREQTKERAG